MIGARSIVEGSPGKSMAHRLDPRAKIILLLLFSVLAVSLDSPRALAALLAVVALAYFDARLPWTKVRLVFLSALLIGWGTMFSQALFYAQEPRTVILVLVPAKTPLIGSLTGGIYVYYEGLIHGAVQSMRIVSMLALGLLFSWCTDPRDALMGLVGLKVPYGMAFMVVTALRFLPIILAEAALVAGAQRLRGFNPRRLNLIALARATVLVLKPILANSLRRAGTLTLSVQSRAFDPTVQRTFLREFRWSWIDLSLVASMAMATTIELVAKALYALYVNEMYYSSGLRELYTIAKELL